MPLTITADDFGIGVDTSRGIVEAFHAGAISRASVMTGTGDHLARSAELLPGTSLPLGLHVTLTGNASAPLKATRASGLLTRDGSFHSLPQLAIRCALRRVDPSAIEEEILAQAARFQTILAREPKHLDGHHHAHGLPVISSVIAGLVEKGALPNRVRNTVEPRSLRIVPGDRARRAVVHGLGHRSRVEFTSCRAVLTDGFFGILSRKMLADIGNPWRAYLAAIPRADNLEMMVHPGGPDDSLRGRDDYAIGRPVELAALLALGPATFSPP